jgi:NAD(P)-dependent dehydrogenase (short-subunit alcohol dehydrogenase family)
VRRAVLVTGASRGIGRAVAQAFASEGDRVAVHHRDSAALAEEVVPTWPTPRPSGGWSTRPPATWAAWMCW